MLELEYQEEEKKEHVLHSANPDFQIFPFPLTFNLAIVLN